MEQLVLSGEISDGEKPRQTDKCKQQRMKRVLCWKKINNNLGKFKICLLKPKNLKLLVDYNELKKLIIRYFILYENGKVKPFSVNTAHRTSINKCSIEGSQGEQCQKNTPPSPPAQKSNKNTKKTVTQQKLGKTATK